MASDAIKICPECSAENDANALFCEECGTSLGNVQPQEQMTANFAAVQAPSQATQTTAIAPAVTSQPYAAPVSAPLAPAQTTAQPYVMESPRGAVLGWIAGILILLIFGFFVWSSLLSDATRDRFTGFF